MAMRTQGKRIKQVNVRMSDDDSKLLSKAANLQWPDAAGLMSASSIVLGLARIGAATVVERHKNNRRKPE